MLLAGEQGWHVHSLPVDQTVSRDEQCLSTWVGPHYDPTGARENVNYKTDCSPSTPQKLVTYKNLPVDTLLVFYVYQP